MENTLEEFKSIVNRYQAIRKSNTKKKLAFKMQIDPTYISKLYHGHEPILPHIMEKLKLAVRNIENDTPMIPENSNGHKPIDSQLLNIKLDLILSNMRNIELRMNQIESDRENSTKEKQPTKMPKTYRIMLMEDGDE